MKIYTKTGDKGQTCLATGERVSKTDPRLEAYGTADELNSYIGWLRVTTASYPDIDNLLREIQNNLFNLGGLLAGATLSISETSTHQLEEAIDHMQEQLPTLHAFLLPAGTESVTRCHICRCVTRRLERLMLQLPDETLLQIAEELRYINRLSDFFFVLSRHIGQKEHAEVTIWKADSKK